MFKRASGTPNLLWVPLDHSATYYVGQLVKPGGDGWAALGTASGVNDTSQLGSCIGIIQGFNARTPLYDATYKTDKLATQFVFNNPNQTSACGCGESVQLTPASDRAPAVNP